MSRLEFDPYYVHPKYEEGEAAAREELVPLVDHLGGVIDELGAYIFRLGKIENRLLTEEEIKLVALGVAALDRIKEAI